MQSNKPDAAPAPKIDTDKIREAWPKVWGFVQNREHVLEQQKTLQHHKGERYV